MQGLGGLFTDRKKNGPPGKVDKKGRNKDGIDITEKSALTREKSLPRGATLGHSWKKNSKRGG